LYKNKCPKPDPLKPSPYPLLRSS